jgi:hypothetical protein
LNAINLLLAFAEVVLALEFGEVREVKDLYWAAIEGYYVLAGLEGIG